VDHLFDGRFHFGTQAVDARGPALRDHGVAVAIEHEAGQSIGLAEHQPVIRLPVEFFAQRQRDAQAVHQQRCVEWIGRIAPDDSRRDQRARIHVCIAEELIAVGQHLHRGARLELCQRRGGRIHFIAEDPQMAGA
jgi:hypothetical protein